MKKILYRPFVLSLLLTTNCFGVDEFLDVTPQDQQNMIPQIKFMYIHFYDARTQDKIILRSKSNNQNIIFESADLKYIIQMDSNGSNIEFYENNQIKNLISKLGYRLTWLNDSTQFAPRSGEPYSLEKFKNLINHECKVRGSLGLSFGRQGINNSFNEIFYGVFDTSPKEFHVTFDRISFVNSIKNWSINKADTLCFTLPYKITNQGYEGKLLNSSEIKYELNIPTSFSLTQRELILNNNSKFYNVNLVATKDYKYSEHLHKDTFIKCVYFNELLSHEIKTIGTPKISPELKSIDMIKNPQHKQENNEINIYPDAMIVMPENFDLSQFKQSKIIADVKNLSIYSLKKEFHILFDHKEGQYYLPLIIKEELEDSHTKIPLPGNLVYLKTPIKFNKEEVERIIGCNNTSPLIIIPDIFENQNIFRNQISTIRFYDHNTLNCKTSFCSLQSFPSLCLDFGPKSVERWLEMHKEPFIMKRFYDEFRTNKIYIPLLEQVNKDLKKCAETVEYLWREYNKAYDDEKEAWQNYLDMYDKNESYNNPFTRFLYVDFEKQDLYKQEAEDQNKFMKRTKEKIDKKTEEVDDLTRKKYKYSQKKDMDITYWINNDKIKMISYALKASNIQGCTFSLDSISPRMYKDICNLEIFKIKYIVLNQYPGGKYDKLMLHKNGTYTSEEFKTILKKKEKEIRGEIFSNSYVYDYDPLPEGEGKPFKDYMDTFLFLNHDGFLYGISPEVPKNTIVVDNSFFKDPPSEEDLSEDEHFQDDSGFIDPTSEDDSDFIYPYEND